MTGGIALDGEETASTRRGGFAMHDQALWAALGANKPNAVFGSAWLTLLCRNLDGVSRGILVMRDDGGELLPAIHWPAGDGGSSELSRTIELCLEHKRGIANISRGGAERSRDSYIAYPVLLDKEVQAIVGVEAATPDNGSARDVMGRLHWATGWLELAQWRAKVGDLSIRLSRMTAALEILSVTGTANRFEDQARNAATEIANRIGAARVSIGWARRQTMRVVALSHGLDFSHRMDTVTLLAAAMDETLDQARTVCHPPSDAGRPLVTRAHTALAEKGGSTATLSVPLVVESRIAGVILAEFDTASPLEQHQVDLLEAVASLLGPTLERARAAQRPILVHTATSLRDGLRRLLGPGHLTLKLVALAAGAIITFFTFFQIEYRVGGRATVEGEIRRTIAAALDGYVASENARAGQTVRKDDVLATLDSTEFTLQRLRWIAVREQHRLELSKDLAAGQRAEVNILRAQADEADAQIALLDDEIKRTRIVAPFDGIVLSGDLSQSVGAPVQRAQILFEVAPLDAYRVIIRVPDSEIGAIRPGGHGMVVLSALPDERFPFTVAVITPVAEVSEGENAFKVEGRLDRISPRLRPNMEGVARVDAGTERLIWVWTHRLIAAARLAIWSWWP